MEKNKGLFSFRKHPVGNFLDGKKGRKRKGSRRRQSIGILIAAALIFNTLPASGFAVSASEQEKGLCEHHPEHTAECGYAEAQPCTHEHGEECYTTVTECVHEHTDGCYPEVEETEESTGEGDATTSDAGNREPSLCNHVCSEESGCITKILDCHHEHDESCGYQEAQDCGYVCEICNGTEPENTENNAENDTENAGTDTAECICETLCTEDSINGDCPVCGADDASLLDCKGKVSEENTGEQEDTGICKHHQEHDADCSYIPKSEDGEGSPCTYECRICPVEDLIADLPDKVTEDNAEEVRAQLDKILALYRELDEDEQEEIDLFRCYALQEALDNADAPMTADGRTDQQGGDKASVTIGGETLYYATLEEAFDAANGKTATITMLNDAECVHSGSAGSPLNINGGNVTLNLNGKTLSGVGYGDYGIINVSGGSLLVQGEEGKVNVTVTGLSCRESGKLTVEDITLNLVGDSNSANAGVANQGGTVILNGTQMTGAASEGQIYHYSGTTTINSVTATEATESNHGSVYYQGDSGTLTINGGTFDKITVSSHNNGGVQSVAGLLGEGCAYKKQGGTWATDDELAAMEISNVTVEKIPLTINPQGDTSWYYSTQQTHTLAMNAASVDSSDSVTYVWKSGTETLDCTSDTCTVPAGTPVGNYTYTCGATCDSYTLSHTFTFKIEKSGTEFTGGIKTYNGSEETTGFAADDTITVKVAPTATGTAPQAAARLRADPTAGQMALFVGDVQVSEPVKAGADGTYIMTVSAAEVLLKGNAEPNGNAITLTAKFVGNGNMADAVGTVDVRISAVAMAEKDNAVIGYYGESNLADAFGESNDGATVTLLDNITTSTRIDVYTENLTLDLNGKTYTCTDNAAFQISFGSLTIKGSGVITASSFYCLVVDEGTLNIESGSFSAADYAVYVVHDGTLQLTGGSFTGGKNAIKYASGDVTEALKNYGGANAPHYAFYDGSSPYTPSGSSLPSGTFTVKECQHTGVEVTNLGDGKHGLTCPYCGYHYEHTTTLTATASGNTVTLNGGCDTDGCGYQTTLGTASFTFPKVTYGQSGDVTCTWDGPTGYYGLIEVVVGSETQFDKNEDENIAERSWTLAQLFGNTKVTAGKHTLKVSFFSDFSDVPSNECKLDFTIDPVPLTPSITGTATKPYDGTTDCNGTGLSIALDGVVNGDDVTATAGYAYDNANAGENKTITASGITLEGDSKDNYTLSSTTATTTGTITKSQPAIVFASGYNPSKDYDGQAIPDPTADNLTITGADFSDVTFAWSATPKDAGTYTLTAAIPETTNTEAVSDTLTVTISPKAVTPAITITPSSYEYTGSAIHPSGSAVKVMDGNTVIPDSEYTLSYGENTQVGNGSVTVTDKENGNYTIARTTETFTITKANQATLTITGAPSSVTYGDTFQLGFSGGSGSGALSWAASGATVDNAGNVTITRAGMVIITAAKAGDSNYSGTEARIMLNVSKKALTVSDVDAQDRAYDGTNKVAITAVTLSGIVPGDAGKVEVDLNGIQGTLSGVNAGTYTSVTLPQLNLTGEGSGNYTLLQPETAVPASVKITPLDAVITIGTDTYHKTFGDATFTLDVTDNNTEADVRYEVTEGADVVSVENGTVTIRNAGTVTITVSLPATANYNAAENKTITITVDKKNGYTVAALNRNYFYQDGGTDSIDLAALLPKDCGNVTYGEPAVSGNVAYSVDPAVSGGKLSYILDSGNINDEGTIAVTVETQNYEDITVTVNVKLTDQMPVSLKTGTEVTLKNSVLIYGEPLSDLVFNEAEFVGTDGKTVAGTLAWKEAAATPNAGTTSAVWVFTPTENKYTSLEGTAAITVNKAVPTVSETPAVEGRIYNPSLTLKDGDLSSATVTGVDGNTLKGGWNWQSADIVPTVTGSGYAATFTPEDTTNYETVTTTITVNVTKATPYIAKSPAAAGITYGDTLNASSLSGGTVLYGDGKGQAGDSDGNTVAVTGTFTWQEPSAKPVVADSNVTEYTVVFTPSDTANYNPVEANVTLTVNKAQNAPNMPGSTMDVSNSLEKVGDVSLPEGWEWQASDQDTALEVGKPVSAVAVYAGADKGNYENETVMVAITRSACDHVAGEILYTGAGEKAPTCTEDGLGHRECTKCGSVVESGIVVKALGHTGGTATCSKRAVCTRCGQPYGDTDGSVHGDTEVRGFVAATCTAGGYTGDTYCKDCGARTKTGNATPALGHNYTSTVTKEPTTGSEGTRTYICTRCGHSYTESIPKLPEETHHHSYSGSVTKQPTCTDTGIRTYTCSCGDSYTETIAALGHHYQSSVTKQPTATAEGVMTYTCDRCGHSYTRPIAKLPGDDITKPKDDTTKPKDDTTKLGDDTAKLGDTKPDGGSAETRPDTGIPFIKDEDGKIGWDVIRAEEEQAQEGSTINVDMNGSVVVPGDIFDSIKGKDIIITFDMGSGILWSVNGKSIIIDKVGDIDFSVQTGVNTVPVDIVNNVTGERYSIQISLAHEGEFGFTAVLSIGLGRENAGYTASLYYYNESTGELEFICSDEVAEDGTVSLAFTHASNYVIAIDGDEEEESISATEPAQPENQDADSIGQAEESPQAGQAWRPWWLIVVGALVIIMGVGVFFVVKKGKDGDNGQ